MCFYGEESSGEGQAEERASAEQEGLVEACRPGNLGSNC